MYKMEFRPYGAIVNDVEAQLQQIGSSHHPTEVQEAHVAPWSLLARARSLFEGVGFLAHGPSDASAKIVLRSLADLSILVAWLRLDVGLHTRLWTAEGLRRQLEEVGPSLERRGYALEETESMRAALKAKREIISQARAEAIEAQVVKKDSRSLIPSLEVRVDAVGTQGASDAYEILFGPWSEWVHTGAGSLPVDYDRTAHSIRFDEGAPTDPIRIRGISCALYAHVLAELSRWLGLAIDERCNRLRQALVEAEQQKARRGRAS